MRQAFPVIIKKKRCRQILVYFKRVKVGYMPITLVFKEHLNIFDEGTRIRVAPNSPRKGLVYTLSTRELFAGARVVRLFLQILLPHYA